MPDGDFLLPRDAYNSVLVNHVHPPGWTNPRPASKYHLVVIGGGTAGLVTAMGAAGLGAKVALVEKHFLGGDCLNYGCVPSKALLRSARAMAAVRRASEFGIHQTEAATIDFAQVMERMRRLRAGISHHDSAQRFQQAGVDVFLGTAAFESSDTIVVGDSKLRFKKAVIATGARPVVPEIPGLTASNCLTNESVFSLTELPRRLAVIGGGPIGCELAQAFARFGSQVTLFEPSDHILKREDADAAAIVQSALQTDGIQIVTHSKLTSVASPTNGKTIRFEQNGQHNEFVCDEILVGAGRAPNVEGMNLDRVGVAFDTRHGVQVDACLQTTNPRILACGDVCSAFKFTHAADFQARLVIRNALFWGRAKHTSLLIPWATYTDPEIAHVGLSEHEATERGIKVQTLVQDLKSVDRAILDGEDNGFVKVHLKVGTDQILGATIVAAHAGDLISEITLAMTNGIGLGRIANVIHPYPTQAEAIRKLGDAYNRTRLTPFVKRLFSLWLR